jgi:two-component system, NtrC family, response regulator HydG
VEVVQAEARTEAGGADRRRTTVLVVDDDEGFQETIALYMRRHRVLVAYNGWQAREQLLRHHIDVVLLDLGLPDTDGMDLLKQIRAERDDVEIIVVTSQADFPKAVRAGQLGAFDFLPKTLESYQQINEHLQRALENRKRRRAEMLARTDEVLATALELLEDTTSNELRDKLQLLRQVSPTPLTILIEGESGVGKELIARYIHIASTRSSAPFVPVNMAAIPSTLLESTLFGHEKGAFTSADRQRLGKFELADGGTLFLDEIGELEPAAQAKLLRALQERAIERLGGAEPSPIDVRVVAATNKDLEDQVRQGRFREDLWYRLNVVRVRIPPLRQRRTDIPALIGLLALKHARLMGREVPIFTDEAVEALGEYNWPGNVRELENLVMRMVALYPGRKIRLADIPVEYCVERLGKLAMWTSARDKDVDRSLYSMARDHFERYFVRHMVERCGGNKAEAARRLGVAYATVKNKMDRAGSSGDGHGDEEPEAEPTSGRAAKKNTIP